MSTAHTLILINVLTGLTIVVGFFNNVLITSYFGLNRQIDAFFAAFVIPSVFMSLTADFMGRNFLPAFSELKKKNGDEASVFASSLINFSFLFGIAFVIIILPVAGPLFSLILPGFTPDKIGLVKEMFLIMSPAVALMPVTTFTRYILQYEKSYVRITLSQILLPMSFLVVILVGHKDLRELSLPAGFLLGHVGALLLVAKSSSFKYSFSLDLRGSYVRRVFVNSGVLMTSGIIGKAQPLIEKFYASLLGAGTISALAIACKVSQPIQQVSTSGISLVSFSKTSKLVAEGDMKQAGALVSQSVIMIMLSVVPVVIWLAFVSDEVLRLLFLRGKFDITMHRLVVEAFWGQLPSVVFLSGGTILSNTFYVLNRTRIPAILNVSGVLLYLLIVKVLSVRFGILGISLSFSLMSCVSFVTLIILLARERISFSAGTILTKLFTYAVSSATCFWIAVNILNSLTVKGILFCLATFGIGMIMYAVVLIIARESGMLYVKDKFLSGRTK